MELDRFLESWDRVRAVTLKAAAAMPEAEADFRPVPEVFSFRELLAHILGAEQVFVGGVTAGRWERPPADGAPPDIPVLLERMEKVHADSKARLAGLDQATLGQVVKAPFGVGLPRMGFLWLLRDHEVHHRGQMYTYLRLKGVTPPFFAG